MNHCSKLWSLLVENVFGILVGILAVLIIIFFTVMFSECAEGYLSKLLGDSEKSNILKFLGISMGGILFALQVFAPHTRAKTMEDTANAQADAVKEQVKTNQNIEQGQWQERLKNAIEHLGHGSVSVRLGGVYELFHLARDTEERRQTVLDILCAHIRQTTGAEQYRRMHKTQPSEEVQSMLTLLFVKNHQAFKGCRADLQGSWLNGANLRMARLGDAVLTRAFLLGVDLGKAELQVAGLEHAHMQGANLRGARLQGAYLSGAFLYGATLIDVGLQGAMLRDSHLQGSDLFGARLQAADLHGARLEGVASPDGFCGPLSFADRMRRLIDRESQLNWMIFEGELSQNDVEFLSNTMPDENKKEFCDKMNRYIDQLATGDGLSQRRGVVTGDDAIKEAQRRGAIIGIYTTEEAEQWIAEYEEAMSDVPEAGDS